MTSPFPYFGSKRTIHREIWRAFGDVRNYVEPFAGSLAVLLNRPHPVTGPETANDLDCNVANVWRVIQSAPEELAEMLVGPVSEVDTEARHNALVQGIPAMRDLLADPLACDIERAAWWIKGANEWIGTGWCSGEGPWSWSPEGGWTSDAGTGINRQLPHLSAGKGIYAQRVEWIAGWLCALRDRLCSVRITCGDWSRICEPSGTTRHGLTAVFLDPPYEGTEYVYRSESVSDQVRQWCAEKGRDPLLRIVLAGRVAEHDALLESGWWRWEWSGSKGYSNTAGRHGEALWCSPGCQKTEQLKQAEML